MSCVSCRPDERQPQLEGPRRETVVMPSRLGRTLTKGVRNYLIAQLAATHLEKSCEVARTFVPHGDTTPCPTSQDHDTRIAEIF